jgi:hypothetical protein
MRAGMAARVGIDFSVDGFEATVRSHVYQLDVAGLEALLETVAGKVGEGIASSATASE